MTHGYETMKSYINGQIESIDHTLEFTVKNRKDWSDRMDAIRYATRTMREEKEQGFGALIYAKIYERTITEDEFDELSEKLREAHFSAERKAYEVIR